MKSTLLQIALALLALQLAIAAPTNYYANPQNDDFIYVHLIPHTHDDVGWLKTPDQYYYGDRQDIQRAGVQYILSSVISTLQKNPSYKFIYVEVAFFYKWWNEQNKQMQNIVRQLIKNGQLEFINGGWSMNDEGTTYYEDIIDQMTIGHQWLFNTFGVIPSIGWQIDTFGHSSSQAALFSQMGFNGFFAGRIDYYDVRNRQKTKNLEMVWHPRQESQDNNYIFFRWMDHTYNAPPGFCFDQECKDEPIMDDPRLENYNLDKKADELAHYLRNQSQTYFNSQVHMQVLGQDFAYQNAYMWYKNYDKLIAYINNNKAKYNMELLYSTPSQYLLHVQTLMSLKPRKFSQKLDDFMPITEVPQHGYQTGYFTSRVALKGMVYDYGRYLQLARTFLALLKFNGLSKLLAKNEDGFIKSQDSIQQAMGVLMHHDAITGTEKQAVANDYVRMLTGAFSNFNSLMIAVLREQSLTNIQELLSLQWCHWNVSTPKCNCVYNNIINKKPVVVAVYNQAFNLTNTLRIKVPGVLVDILDIKNNLIEGEIICANKSLTYDCDLYFQAQIPQFTLTYFKLVPNKDSRTTRKIHGTSVYAWNFKKKFELKEGSKYLTLSFYSQKLTYQYKSKVQDFEISYNKYDSYNGEGQQSGPYVFRPAHPTQKQSNSYNTILHKTMYVGDIVSVLHFDGTHIDTQVRFYNDNPNFDSVVEVQSHVYSIPGDGIGREIVMHMEFDVNNQNLFYTDSNGLEMMQRKLNSRPTFQMDTSEPAAGNFFPVNKMIMINDSTTTVAVLNDRSQAGTSLKNGEIELMIHRRLFSDDGHGVGEDLNEFNENGVGGLEAKVRHWIVFDDSNKMEQLPRLVQWKNDQQPLQYYAPSISTTFTQYATPLNVGIGSLSERAKLYLQYLGNNNYLMRLHNLQQSPSSFVYDKTIFDSMIQYTLTGNQMYENWLQTKMKWQETAGSEDALLASDTPAYAAEFASVSANMTEVQVKRMQIQTYMVQPKTKKSGVSADFE